MNNILLNIKDFIESFIDYHPVIIENNSGVEVEFNYLDDGQVSIKAYDVEKIVSLPTAIKNFYDILEG